MSDEELAKLSHMLDAVAEHAKLQEQSFTWVKVAGGESGVSILVEFRPSMHLREWVVQFTASGRDRNEVLASMLSAMQNTHKALSKFLGERT